MTTPINSGTACAALGCGSLLPLSSPRACSRELPSRRDLAASKLAEAKAAASCRAPKLRVHARWYLSDFPPSVALSHRDFLREQILFAGSNRSEMKPGIPKGSWFPSQSWLTFRTALLRVPFKACCEADEHFVRKQTLRAWGDCQARSRPIRESRARDSIW
jgi:hypothetical protein